MTGAIFMRPAGELVAAGFERARAVRFIRAQATRAETLARRGRIDPECARLFARWCDALAEMAEQGLWDEDVSPGAIMAGAEREGGA